jgi:hypothetical protein
MQQRQLRLGDILDDYCPRERRITNHAIVAMIAEDVRQTRCTTCDAEHEYKQARVPPQRRRKASELAPPAPAAGTAATHVVRAAAPPLAATAADRGLPSNEEPPEAEESASAEAGAEPEDDLAAEGPVHRQLIRATLPRPEGQAPVRPMPEFTMRHAPAPGRFRSSGGRGQERHRAPHGGSGAPRHAAGRSHERPFSTRSSRPASAMRPGKKRSK